MSTLPRTLIVSNRLPVRLQVRQGTITMQKSEGGLATALDNIYRDGDNLWIGWPGTAVEAAQQEEVTDLLAGESLMPVFMSQEEMLGFYEGFSNETLWPLFHYFPGYTAYNPAHWETYKQINQRFADAIIRNARKGDTIWIHDYQLLLVPAMVREQLPEATIGFFLHIPFPSYEIFRQLPWKEELLDGIMGADLIGFHTYDHVRHFITTAGRVTDAVITGNELRYKGRRVCVDAFPISIDFNKFYQTAMEPQTLRVEESLKKMAAGAKILISIDRLDYSKGILQRLEAFRLLLDRHPELRRKVRLVQVIVPSRDNVSQYRQLKEEVNRLVGELNGQYGTFDWLPIHHFYRSFPPNLLSALYKSADVALVTPMRDGMNLVSKEYVASRTDGKGVLVLSEMAGASKELSEALLVNPNDIVSFADLIYRALTMPEAEQEQRIRSMQRTLAKFDVYKWSERFLDKLGESKAKQERNCSGDLDTSAAVMMKQCYDKASRRLILLDYDGTLVPFAADINAAVPDMALLQLLASLAADPQNKVVITSGRPRQFLEQWLGHLPIDFISEHGAWCRRDSGTWICQERSGAAWKPELRPLLQRVAEQTPGSFIEEKTSSLAWHYRNAEAELGTNRAKGLVQDVQHLLAPYGLQVLKGDKVIEIKSSAVNKGKAAEHWLDARAYDFVLAMGDDDTDEDTFRALPQSAYSVKVGNKESVAAYCVTDWNASRALLGLLAGQQLKGNRKTLSGTQIVELVPRFTDVAAEDRTAPVTRMLQQYHKLVAPMTVNLLLPAGMLSYLFSK